VNFRRRSLRIVAMVVVVSLPLLGASGVASAKAARGCHKTHTCKSSGGTPTGSGSGADPAPFTVQVDPDPLIETGQSGIVATVQVETSPSFAGDMVTVSSPQLAASCATPLDFISIQNLADSAILDDDGNATVLVTGLDCAPGSDVIEADLDVAPYYTALETLVVNPPVVTPTGLFGYPATSGTITTGEVETSDVGGPSLGSDVFAVFYVESSPVYAEQPVEISSDELETRCGGFWQLAPGTAPGAAVHGVGFTQPPATTTLDDDGNAVFFFEGASCAAGPSEVTADVEAGTHPTYTTIFNIVAPQPTI
jgi:hypothetical protein